MHYNMVNEVMNAKVSSTTPKVGMCATQFVGTDRWPYVVTEVLGKNKIRVEHMNSFHYTSEKEIDENGIEFLPKKMMGYYTTITEDGKTMVPVGEIYTYRKNKRWMPAGKDMWGTASIHLGKADEYRDPDF